MKNNRRNARILCMQVLYAYLQQENKILDEVKTNTVRLNTEEELDKKFFETLLKLTVYNMDEIDEKIKERSKNWDFNRITLIDKIILRQSIAELLYEDDVPPRVTISEAIELSKIFSTDESHVFVNGILDRIYKDLIKNGTLVPEINVDEILKEEK